MRYVAIGPMKGKSFKIGAGLVVVDGAVEVPADEAAVFSGVDGGVVDPESRGGSGHGERGEPYRYITLFGEDQYLGEENIHPGTDAEMRTTNSQRININ